MSTGGVRRSFIAQHASALFLAALVVIGIVLMVAGYELSEPTATQRGAAGSILMQFAGALIAVSLTAFLFNLPDLRNYLARTIADLFSRGDVVAILSEPTQGVLRRRLVLELAGETVESYEPTLMSELELLSQLSLRAPYATNHTNEIRVTASPDVAGLFVESSVASYRLHTHHLRLDHYPFTMRYSHEVAFPRDIAPAKDKWIESFSFRAGDKQFGRSDLDVTVEDLGELRVFRADFSHQIDVREFIDVCCEAKLLCTERDPLLIVSARYPTQGMRVSLTFDSERLYDCAWFRRCEVEQKVPSRDILDSRPDGITVSTNNWILPGEGVVLYYYTGQRHC